MIAAGVEFVSLSQLLGVMRPTAKSKILVHKTSGELVVPFPAHRESNEPGTYYPCIVTAILERTATYHALGKERTTGVARLDRILVDPQNIQWQVKRRTRDGWRTYPKPKVEPRPRVIPAE